MDCNGNNSMGEPGPSKTPEKNKDTDDEMEIAPSTSRKRCGMQIDHSDDSDDDGFETEDNGGESTRRQKRPRLVNGHPTDYIDDGDTDSSDFETFLLSRYVASHSHNSGNLHVPEYVPLPLNNDLNFISGYWILVTNIMEGWNKSHVRGFFRSHFGLEYQNSKPCPGVHLNVNDFRMMFTFTCKEAREFVILYLTMKDLQNCFNFIAIDQIPEGSLESDSDDDDDIEILDGSNYSY